MRLHFMRRGIGVLVLLAITVSSTARDSGERIPLHEPLHDPCLLRAFADLYVDAAGLGGARELAAFVVRGNDARLSLSRWPSSAEVHAETFTGSRPDAVVAIVHTHPNQWPQPSRADIATATRLDLPVYVVTRRIWVVDPETGEPAKLTPRGWIDLARDISCDPDDGTPGVQTAP